jgi:hypothetical protein
VSLANAEGWRAVNRSGHSFVAIPIVRMRVARKAKAIARVFLGIPMGTRLPFVDETATIVSELAWG